MDASGERELLIKAVRVNTLSKLTYDDTRQFLALIGDVFPGAESSDIPGVSRFSELPIPLETPIDCSAFAFVDLALRIFSSSDLAGAEVGTVSLSCVHAFACLCMRPNAPRVNWRRQYAR